MHKVYTTKQVKCTLLDLIQIQKQYTTSFMGLAL